MLTRRGSLILYTAVGLPAQPFHFSLTIRMQHIQQACQQSNYDLPPIFAGENTGLWHIRKMYETARYLMVVSKPAHNLNMTMDLHNTPKH